MYRTSPFSRFANSTARAIGHPAAFVIAGAVVVLWLITGPIFGFSDTWQLVINTGTTIVTFLMVFLIQNTQNRDSAARAAQARRADPRDRRARTTPCWTSRS